MNMMDILIVWIVIILSKQKISLSLKKNSVKIKIFYGIVMASQKDNIFQFNQYVKLDKMSHIISVDLEFLI